MKHLVIVESPSKTKTIQKYLGNDYDVVSSKGHIRDLSTSGKGGLGVDIDNGFKPHYSVSKDKSDTVKQLKTLVKKADQVFLATDPDREGEAISWHLADELKLDDQRVHRVVFNEITPTAVLKAFDNTRSIDMDLVHSQETRRILDRIIGFKLSKLLQNKISSKSAGRVQSVALKLIVEKEKEIQAFVPEEKWTIKAQFKKDGIEFDAEIDRIDGKKAKLKTKEESDAVMSRLSDEFKVSDIEVKEAKKTVKYPFITSTLQQEAANKLSFQAKKTMRIAQKLYEGINGQDGLITYMRTDSARFSEDFVKQAQAFIVKEFGKAYLGSYHAKKSDNAQDAHEGIRVTNINRHPDDIKDQLTADEYKLYSLIYARSLAALMSSDKVMNTTIRLSQNELDFVAKGNVRVFDGYLKVYSKYEQSKDKELPQLSLEEILKSIKKDAIQSFTNPPLRYSEARLIDALDQKGIGRPSTYAMIIDTLIARGYTKLERPEGSTSKTRVFIPTEQGFLTDEKLAEHFSTVINVDYTAQMENELDEIAEGKKDHVTSLSDFYQRFEPLVNEAYQSMEKIQPEKVGRSCPECGGDLVIRKGRYGPFVACGNYPKCKFVEKSEQEKDEPTGDPCPNCGLPLVKKNGRFGPFIACSNYPTCKTIIKTEKPKAEAQPTGENCPECGSPLVIRKNRFGKNFVGCSNYPKCRYIQSSRKKTDA